MLERPHVVGVVEVRLGVAGVARRHLLVEALGLDVRVVELGEGVGQLHAGDVELEALGEARVRRVLLGQRRHLHRVMGEEGRLHQLLLRRRLEQGGQQVAVVARLGKRHVALARAPPRRRRRPRDSPRRRRRSSTVACAHGQPRPRPGEIDRLALEAQRRRPQHPLGRRGEHLLGEVHQHPVVDVGPVELEHGELGVVAGGDPLVAEVAVDLVHPRHVADQQALEEQLRRDAQVEVEIERVVVGLERPRRGTAGDDVHHRRLDLEEAVVLEEAAQRRHQPRPRLEHLPRLGVGDEVEVALAVARLDVGQAVELLRQRAQRLGEQDDVVDEQRQLAHAGPHQGAGSAHQVAEVEVGEQRLRRFGELVAAHEELQPGLAVGEVDEPGLAVLADRAHAAGDARRDRRRLELLGGRLPVRSRAPRTA